MDLVLSSGFLAFARHLGFLSAVQRRGLEVDALVGTSSGALVGALWAAGLSLDRIQAELTQRRVITYCGPNLRPWRGLLSMAKLIRFLAQLLPERIEELTHPMAIGVVSPDGHQLLTSGPLPPAVAASCAMPGIFAPVEIDGVQYRDGGAADRLGIEAWRRWRPAQSALVHHVERTAGHEVEASLEGLTIVKTPRSGASFFSLGDFDGQREEARALTATVLDVAENAPPA